MSFSSLATPPERTPHPSRADGGTAFSEAGAWRDVGAGWQRIFGGFRGVGYSIEWHDFVAKREFDWAPSFHPGCVELCLNLDGTGFVESNGSRAEFAPNTAGFYYRQKAPLSAKRAAGERHQFLTVEFSCPFLAKHLTETKAMLHPVVRAAVEGGPCEAATGRTVRLTAQQLQTIATLRQPPVYAAAQSVWYQCKALELAITFLVELSGGGPFPCRKSSGAFPARHRPTPHETVYSLSGFAGRRRRDSGLPRARGGFDHRG